MNNIIFQMRDIPKFQKAYDKAREDKKEDFIFKGKPFVTDYAKYVLEYLKLKFNNNGK